MTRANKVGVGMLGLAIGYFLWYTPYAALTKAFSSGLLPGMDAQVGGLVLLPAAALGTAAGVLLYLTFTSWWRYLGTRVVFGRVLRFPNRMTIIAGLFTALIIATTTLNYTFVGASILFMLLLMRAGVLILSPIVDAVRGRKVRRYSWVALALCLLAVLIALGDVTSHLLTIGALTSLAFYFVGYLGRFEIMSRVAKTGDEQTDRRYFAEEAVSAAVWQVVLCAVLALVGPGQVSGALRAGFTTFLFSPAVLPAFGIGLLYAALYVYGTRIYLDPREFSWCVPANRCASLFSGLVASFGLAWLTGVAAPGRGQLVATALIFLAIFALGYPTLRTSLARVHAPARRPVLLFVCGGNTIRSPMAAAIAKDELESAGTDGRWRVKSAGVAVRDPGAPMSPPAVKALRELTAVAPSHTSRPLTHRLCAESGAVFCMTAAHRDAVIALAPETNSRVHCLDPLGDIGEPARQSYQSYVDCARRLDELVRTRLRELTPATGGG